jgi:hypothetical protein
VTETPTTEQRVGTLFTLWRGKQPVKQSGKEEGRKEADREPKAARTIYHPTPATTRSSCNRIALDISFSRSSASLLNPLILQLISQVVSL